MVSAGDVVKTDQQRFRELFEKLDINHDGKIEVKELAAGLQKLKGVTSQDSAGHAQVCVLKPQGSTQGSTVKHCVQHLNK